MCFSPGGMPGDILRIAFKSFYTKKPRAIAHGFFIGERIKEVDLFFFFDKLAVEKN